MGSKKALIFLLFIVHGILPYSYANEYAVFEQNNKKGLRDARGKEVIPAEYEEIGWSDGNSNVFDNVIGYRIDGAWGLINLKNSRLTPPQFNDLIPSDRYIVASIPDSYKLNSLFGLIQPSGKTLIDFRYTYLLPFGELFVVGRKQHNNIFYGLINQKDELVVPFDYINVFPLTHNLLVSRRTDLEIDLIGPQGNILLDAPVDEVELLNNQILIITKNGKKGLIDVKGNQLAELKYATFFINENNILNGLPIRDWMSLDVMGTCMDTLSFDAIQPIDSGYYKANSLNFSYILNEKGDEIFSVKDYDIQFLNDTLAMFGSRERYGVINYKGDTIVGAQYDSIQIFGNRLLLYSKREQGRGWFLADLYGIHLSDMAFDQIYPLDGFNIAFKANGFWGIMDHYGKEKIFAKFDSIFTKLNDLFLVDFYGETGVIDEFGEWKIYPQKGDVYMLSNGNYLISSYFQSRVINRWGNELYSSKNYLRPQGSVLIEEDFEDNFGLLDSDFRHLLPVENEFVGPIIEDSVFLFKNSLGWGIIDRSGTVTLKNDMRFEQILGYNEEFIGVRIDGLYGFVDLNGKLRISNRYEDIGLFHDGIANIKILSKWGCINKYENIVVQPYFDEIGIFKNNLAIASKNKKYGIINNEGKTVIRFDYDSIYRIQNGNFICILNSSYGLINQEGEIMFYPKYGSILDLNNGFVIAERKNKFGVFSSSGVFIIPVIYDRIIYDPFQKVYLVAYDPEWEIIMDLNASELY